MEFEDQNSQSQIVAQNFERIHTDFLMKLNNAKGDLGEIEDQYLGQLAMVLGVTCLHDPKEYFGHNLIEELYQRALSMIDKDELTVIFNYYSEYKPKPNLTVIINCLFISIFIPISFHKFYY